MPFLCGHAHFIQFLANNFEGQLTSTSMKVKGCERLTMQMWKFHSIPSKGIFLEMVQTLSHPMEWKFVK